MYLISESEKNYINQLLKNASHPMMISETLACISDDVGEDDFLKHLGALSLYEAAKSNERFDADYLIFGRNYWKNIQKELFNVICSKNSEYAGEMQEIRKGAKNALIIIIPIILKALNLPSSAAGIAIVISLLIVKIGINSLCKTWKEQTDE